MPVFTSKTLHCLAAGILTASGVQEDTANQVVESLVRSNLCGMDSHGLVRIPQYLDAIKVGEIVPEAKPRVVRDSECAALVDGQKGFGQLIARYCMRQAIQKASQNTIGAVSLRNVHHIGCLGEYVSMAAQEDFIGLMFANGAKPGGRVAPFGARQSILASNPIAFACPAGLHPAMVADFSTSVVAEGKIRIAKYKGEKIPPNWVIDREGRPTTNPADLYEGGAILCFGEHKGYALALLVDILAGILSGSDTPIFPDYKYMRNGVFMLVIDPTFFRPKQEYKEAIDFLFTCIKKALPAEGMQGALIPGEPETQTRAVREKSGISIDDNLWVELLGLASTLGVHVPAECRAVRT